jgi:hypothetical protein
MSPPPRTRRRPGEGHPDASPIRTTHNTQQVRADATPWDPEPGHHRRPAPVWAEGTLFAGAAADTGPRTPGARTSDPATSWAAAARARLTAGTVKAEILDQLERRGPLTDDGIAEGLPHRLLGTVAKRRAEIVDDGLVVDTGQLRETRRGVLAKVWQVAR